jgi:Ca2+:H+ antiporter
MALILILVYCLYMYFEHGTHTFIFAQESPKVAVRPSKHRLPQGSVHKALTLGGGIGTAIGRTNPVYFDDRPPMDEIFQRDAYERQVELDEEENIEIQLHLSVCVAVLIIGTAVMAFNTQFMTNNIEGLTRDAGVPRDFIGLILLPILSNDITAIQFGIRDDMDFAIQAALGKSLQVTLVVTPVLVLLGWVMQIDDMNLYFDGFQVVAVFVSVSLVHIGIEAGKSNWYVRLGPFLFLWILS